MYKRLKVGTVDRQGVYIEIRLQPTHNGDVLSIRADIRASGHCVGGGQTLDTVRAVAERGTLTAPFTRETIQKLLAIWDRWHLNDMRPGCPHQRALGWVSYDEHPNEPCPECGYRYGSDWLYEALPPEIRAFLEELGVS